MKLSISAIENEKCARNINAIKLYKIYNK